jgi:hypothetical protein
MADIGYAYRKTVYLRFTPADRDPGTPVIAGPVTITNLVGDYTHDFVIDGDDLLVFSEAWKTPQDTSKEIGPVDGAPPNLTVKPDKKIDYEDLSVFAWMWNWCTANPYSDWKAPKPAGGAANEGTQLLSLVSGGNGGISVVSSRVLDFMDLAIDAEMAKKAGITLLAGEYWDTDGKGIALSRTYPDGSLELAAARLDWKSPPGDKNPLLARITVTSPGSIDRIRVRYKARISGENEVAEGECTLSGDTLNPRPSAFSLSQNVPNPFNPVTTIEYSAPGDCHVILKVFNTSGQEVSVLVDQHVRAGAHTVIWDAAGMPSGLYFYTLQSGGKQHTKKMLLLK